MTFQWEYTGNEVFSSQRITLFGLEHELDATDREYTLLNQVAGDYTVELRACNEVGCSLEPLIESYTVPDVPTMADFTLTITVTKDP